MPQTRIPSWDWTSGLFCKNCYREELSACLTGLPFCCMLNKYLNNVIEQDHRFLQRVIKPGLGFKSFNTARRTIKGYEVMHMLRKGQVLGVAKGDVVAQLNFMAQIFRTSGATWTEWLPESTARWGDLVSCLIFATEPIFATQPLKGDDHIYSWLWTWLRWRRRASSNSFPD